MIWNTLKKYSFWTQFIKLIKITFTILLQLLEELLFRINNELYLREYTYFYYIKLNYNHL